jgi:hypothetical protein
VAGTNESGEPPDAAEACDSIETGETVVITEEMGTGAFAAPWRNGAVAVETGDTWRFSGNFFRGLRVNRLDEHGAPFANAMEAVLVWPDVAYEVDVTGVAVVGDVLAVAAMFQVGGWPCTAGFVDLANGVSIRPPSRPPPPVDVNRPPSSCQVVADGDSFLLVWTQEKESTSWTVQSQRYDRSGDPMGDVRELGASAGSFLAADADESGVVVVSAPHDGPSRLTFVEGEATRTVDAAGDATRVHVLHGNVVLETSLAPDASGYPRSAFLLLDRRGYPLPVEPINLTMGQLGGLGDGYAAVFEQPLGTVFARSIGPRLSQGDDVLYLGPYNFLMELTPTAHLKTLLVFLSTGRGLAVTSLRCVTPS